MNDLGLISLTVMVAATLVVVLTWVFELDASSHLRSSAALLFGTLVVVGICTSIAFSAVAQIVALLPERLHYFFFMGTMCPFFLYLPVNISVGNLCDAEVEFALSTTPSPMPAANTTMYRVCQVIALTTS